MKNLINIKDSDTLWRKTYYRNLWQGDLSLAKKFALSQGLFDGRHAFIFAGGPSLRQIKIKSMESKLSNSLVICIKQSIDVVAANCDVLLMNFCNFSKYDWESINCPVLWTAFHKSHPELILSKGAKSNAIFTVVDNSTNDKVGLGKSTAGKQCWQNLYKIKDGNVRWGPGLMYELAIPLAIHAGVSHIYLVAWDIGTINANVPASIGFDNKHFYNESIIEMKTKINNLEIEIVANSTARLRDWLESLGIGLSVVSDKSLVHSQIKRETQWISR